MPKKLRQSLGDKARRFMDDFSLPKQLAGQNVMAEAAKSTTSKTLRPRLEEADRVGTKQTRDETFAETLPDGRVINQTIGRGALGGATMDNEENYLIKKLFGGGLGLVNIENQARI